MDIRMVDINDIAIMLGKMNLLATISPIFTQLDLDWLQWDPYYPQLALTGQNWPGWALIGLDWPILVLIGLN